VISLRAGERFLYFRIWIDLSDRHLGNETISSEQKEYQRICLEYEKPLEQTLVEVKTFPKYISLSPKSNNNFLQFVDELQRIFTIENHVKFCRSSLVTEIFHFINTCEK